VGATEQSPSYGTRIFRAALDLGEAAWVRSQARRTCCPGRDAKGIARGVRRWEPEGKTQPQNSPSLEIERHARGDRTEARYKETITCSGYVAIRLAQSDLSPISL
jgi:hypothetical protein